MARFWPVLLFQLLPSVASGADARHPVLNPTSEVILLDREAKLRAGPSRGSWDVKPGLVAPQGKASKVGWFWLTKSPGARFDNGTVRARFAFDRRPEFTLLVRATTRRRGRQIDSAFGLRVCGRFAWMIELRRGKVHVLEHKVFVKPGARKSMEVILSALGPHVIANLYDPGSGEHLATLSTHEASGHVGVVGLMAGCNRGRTASGLVLLATRPACSAIPDPETDGPPIAIWGPAGEATAFAKVATELETSEEQPPVTVYRSDVAGLETLYCDGRTLLQVTTDLPWKYLDPGFLRHRKAGLEVTPTGLRIDRSYKDPERIEALLRAWHERHPDQTSLEKIGQSWQGRPLWALAISNNLSDARDRPAILLNGAHHGEEVMSTEFVLDAIQTLLENPGSDPRVARWMDELVVWAVPVVNPDGLAAFLDHTIRAGRKNGRDQDRDGIRKPGEGVDLNRNYPFRWGVLKKGRNPESRFYRGPEPASEPETRAMMGLAGRERFVASVSYHMGTVAVLAPYTIDGVQNPVPNEAWLVAEEVIGRLPGKVHGRRFEVRRNLYPVDGVDQDWHRHAHGTVALLVEGCDWPPPTETDLRNSIVEAVRPTWTGLLERFLDGPSLSGRVKFSDGSPARVEVRIREVSQQAGEKWTTRMRDGRFDRFLPGPGQYTLSFHPEGLPAHEQTVMIGQQWEWLDVELPSPQAQ